MSQGKIRRPLLILAMVAFASAAQAQYLLETGAPTFTTPESVPMGFVNVANGNLHIEIPITGSPQRGSRPFIAKVVYDSRIWKIVDNGIPTVSGIGRAVYLPTGRAEIHAARIERVNGHGIAQYIDITIALRQAIRQCFPLVSACAASIYSQLSLGWKMLRIAFDRENIDGLWLVRVDIDHEAKVGWQVATDLLPRLACILAAHHIPMFLHVENIRTGTVHGNTVNTVADFSIRIWHEFGMQPAVDRFPRSSGVIAPEDARSLDGDEDAVGVARVKKDRVQAQAASARLPVRSGTVAAQPV